ncbi:MAG: DNA topoisomerase VI subunit B [Fervidicoccaceae archaeon]|jgi:DNA topoisomerase-6 subunit B|nr:DNA topoisomerase VI subunit B [Fervidicoccaceae archaeon]
MSSGVESFRQLSPSEFFYRNREIAGFSNPARAVYQTVREFIENSLDATEVHGILPVITLRISREDPSNPNHITIQVEDNGIGVPPQFIPDAFGRVLYSSKYKFRQTRGMYGLGAKMAILYAQLTTGKPFEIYSSTRKTRYIYYYKLMIDVKRNEPQILEMASWEKRSKWHGTIVKLTIEGEWSRRVRDYVAVYIKRTAIITPYADITAILPSVEKEDEYEVLRFPRVTSMLPRPPKEAKPHPLGIDLEMLKMMINETGAKTVLSFLTNEFQRIGEVTATRILKNAGIDPDKPPRTLDDDELQRLYKAMREEKYWAPTDEPLSPIGEELIRIGLKEILRPEFIATASRKPSSYSGHPFIVEGGIAYGGELASRLDEIAQDSVKGETGPYIVLLRYANKIPLLYDEKTDVMWSIVDPSKFPWRSVYKLEPTDTVAVLIHICSTKVPYKGVGKESVANVEEVESEVRLLAQELARKLREYIQRKKRVQEARQKLSLFLRYIPEVAASLAAIAGNGRGTPDPSIQKELTEKMREIALAKIKLSEDEASA